MPSNPKTRNQWQSPILQGVPYVQQTWGPYIAVRSRLYKTIDTTFVGYTLGHYSWHFHMTSHESSVHIWNISLPSNTFFIFFNWYLKKKEVVNKRVREDLKKNLLFTMSLNFLFVYPPLFLFPGLFDFSRTRPTAPFYCLLFISFASTPRIFSLVYRYTRKTRSKRNNNKYFIFVCG